MGRIAKPRNLYLITTTCEEETYVVELRAVNRRTPPDFHKSKRKRDSFYRWGDGFFMSMRVLAGPQYCNTATFFTHGRIKEAKPIKWDDLPLYMHLPWKSDIFKKLVTQSKF